jgi:hypothetical protein
MARSLITELQDESLRDDISSTSLLRKALLVAKKLNIVDFESWIAKELDGYTDVKDIPAYRTVPGQIEYFNSFRGAWFPITIGNARLAEIMSIRHYFRPIPEIEETLQHMKQGDVIYIRLPHDISIQIMRDIQIDSPPVFMVQASSLGHILQAVKNIVLKWALRLEQDGIKGEGMSFSEQEKIVATKSSYFVNNFYGSVSGSQIQQESTNSNQTLTINESNKTDINRVLDEIESHIDELQLEHIIHEELMAELATMRSQMQSPKPKMPIIGESLRTIRNIVEGCTGSLIASGIIHQVGQILQSLGMG